MPRLKRVGRDELTVGRRRAGRGYIYLSASGTRIKDKDFLARARSLAIPPAWKEVGIAPDPLAHIQACGWDVAGRVQYIYHPDWEARRSRRKLQQLSLLAAALPRLRRRITEDLDAESGSSQLALAIGVALIDRTAMRVGRERYLDANGTRGAGTLYTRDVAVKGDEVLLQFPAKSGKQASYRIVDAKLAAAIGRIKTIAGRRLLMYRDAAGKPRAIRSEQLSAYLREISGAAITAKDFRTLHASALAGEALAKLEPGTSESARKRQITGVTKQVASFLQNTPLICRQSYIAPCLFKLFDSGKLALLWAGGGDGKGGLRQREMRLATVLEAAG